MKNSKDLSDVMTPNEVMSKIRREQPLTTKNGSFIQSKGTLPRRDILEVLKNEEKPAEGTGRANFPDNKLMLSQAVKEQIQ